MTGVVITGEHAKPGDNVTTFNANVLEVPFRFLGAEDSWQYVVRPQTQYLSRYADVAEYVGGWPVADFPAHLFTRGSSARQQTPCYAKPQRGQVSGICITENS